MKTIEQYIECLEGVKSKLMMGSTTSRVEQLEVDAEINVLTIVINDLREVGAISRDTFWNEVG